MQMFQAFHVPFLRKAHATMESYKKCGVGIILKHLHGPEIGVYPGDTEIMYQLSRLLLQTLAFTYSLFTVTPPVVARLCIEVRSFFCMNQGQSTNLMGNTIPTSGTIRTILQMAQSL